MLSSLGFVVVAVALTVLNWRCDFPAQVFALADAEERALLKTLKAEEAARRVALTPSNFRAAAPLHHSHLPSPIFLGASTSSCRASCRRGCATCSSGRRATRATRCRAPRCRRSSSGGT